MSEIYTVLDIETTGFSAAYMSEIIEIGAYHTDSKNILDLIKSPNKYTAMIVGVLAAVILLLIAIILLIKKFVKKVVKKVK